jgi:hypothetical protein
MSYPSSAPSVDAAITMYRYIFKVAMGGISRYVFLKTILHLVL